MAFRIEAQKSKEYDKTITYVTSIDIVEKTIIDRVYVKWRILIYLTIKERITYVDNIYTAYAYISNKIP